MITMRMPISSLAYRPSPLRISADSRLVRRTMDEDSTAERTGSFELRGTAMSLIGLPELGKGRGPEIPARATLRVAAKTKIPDTPGCVPDLRVVLVRGPFS